MAENHLTRKCIVCQSEFVVKTNNRGHAKYCSKKCQRQALRGKATGKKEDRICLQCGKTFKCYPSQGIGKFCSRACRNANWKTPDAERGFEDLTGKVFNRLTVLRYAGSRYGTHHAWECRCFCGKITVTAGQNLKSGRSKSCGCIAKGVGVPKPETKGCRRCGQNFPYTEEFFAKSHLYRWGLRPTCKTCWTPIAKARHLSWRRKLKEEVLRHYSQGDPKCSCCGVSQIEFLTLDHVNNDGFADRIARGAGANFYALLKRNGYPENPPLSVLCMNCNWSRGLFGYCPHQKVSD